MVYSEAVVHAFRPFRPIEADVMKIGVRFLDHDTAVAYGEVGGIGEAYARSEELVDAKNEVELRAVVRRRFVEAFRHYVPEGPRKGPIISAVEQSLLSPPPYQTILFSIRDQGRTLSTIYRFSTEFSAVELVDQLGGIVGTLVRNERFWPSDLLISAKRGTVRHGTAYLYNGSRRLVAEVELRPSSIL